MKEETAVDVEVVSNLPAVRERSGVLLMPVMDIQTAKARLQEFQEFCAHYLQESTDGGTDGGDYGVIPGTKKKTLLKSGADKLCEIYGLYDEYVVMSNVEEWDKGLFDYTLKCVLKSRRDDSMVGAGVGSCSSFESKYRWRDAKRVCPQCGKPTIIKGQEQYGGGYICWKKEGRSDGCGAKFKDTDKSIVDQPIGRMENPDIIDTKNTVLKMAKKRAKIDAVIGVTRSSGIFTQDMEDIQMPPAKPVTPPVAVTTEPIPIRKPTTGGQVQTDASAGNEPLVTASSGRTAAQAFDEAAAKGADAAEYGAVIYCKKAENNSFYAEFRKALPENLQARAEEIGRAWLKNRGYTKDDGRGSLQRVDKALFKEIIADATKYAKGGCV